MTNVESLKDFYQRISISGNTPFIPVGAGHFNVFARRYCTPIASYLRRDFYKISLMTKGLGKIEYNGHEISVNRPCLTFLNPASPYSWTPLSEDQEGWFCLFTQEFIQSWDKQEYPIWNTDNHPVIFLDDKSLAFASYIFTMMMQEISSDYIYKYSKLRSYLQLLVHEAMKYYPETGIEGSQADAAHRLTLRFFDLMEKQFPIENTDMPLKIKAVQEYADKLSVHENHLNHSIKQVTGKSPSQHIATRITKEAKALLKNTDWTVSQIAYSLHFEYVSHLTGFFKKNTGVSPKTYRNT